MIGFSLSRYLTVVIIFWTIFFNLNAATLNETKNEIPGRISLLRDKMRFHNLSAYIVTNIDEHQNDYIVAERDKRRDWISGFSGFQGDVVVTMNKTALWTLGSLFYLAKQEIPDDWLLMESYPSLNGKYLPLEVWLSKELDYGSRVGADPNVPYSQWNDWDSKLRWKNITLVPMEKNLIDLIWINQPENEKYYTKRTPMLSGKEFGNLQKIREDMKQLNSDLYVITDLSEISWILNLKYANIHNLQAFKSHMLLGQNFANLYISPYTYIGSDRKLKHVVKLHYDQFWEDLKSYSELANGILLPKSYNNVLGISYKIFQMVPREKIRSKVSPILLRKDKRNSNEIDHIRQLHVQSAFEMIKWMIKMENEIKKGNSITEIDAIKSLSETCSIESGYCCSNIESVAGYGSNSANFFNVLNKNSTIQIGIDKPFMITADGLYSDIHDHSQYLNTRLARTFHYGTPSEEHKTAYTALLAGIINLMKLTFPLGTSVCMTDIVIQMPLYKTGQEYEYETVQGFGPFLGKYEGFNDIYDLNVIRLQSIGYRHKREWGILLENIVTVIPANTTLQFEKQFMTFEMITLVPYERNLINPDQLTYEQLEWLNNYHQEVRLKINEFLKNEKFKDVKPEITDEITIKKMKEEILNWLYERTKPIERLKSAAKEN